MSFTDIGNYVYYDSLRTPRQYDGKVKVLALTVSRDTRLGWFGWDNTLTYQNVSSGDEVLPLPELIVRSSEGAIEFLNRGKEGFFLMVEGGLIDYACHVNDAATTFREVVDFADAVQKAYEFYLKHPDETLIVVTADHETGGIVLGTGSYQLNLRVLENQRVSLEKLTREIRELRDMKSNQVAWEDVQELLAKNLGFWNTVNLSTEDEQALKNCYRETFSGKTVEMVKNLYSENEPIAQLSINILNRLAKISWASGGHSAGVVPVYAIGVGAERFNGRLDNTDIPKIIRALAKYE